jgi:hypothetical protein
MFQLCDACVEGGEAGLRVFQFVVVVAVLLVTEALDLFAKVLDLVLKLGQFQLEVGRGLLGCVAGTADAAVDALAEVVHFIDPVDPVLQILVNVLQSVHVGLS